MASFKLPKNTGKYLKIGLTLVMIAGLIWAGMKYLRGEEIMEAFRRFQLRYLPLMLLLALGALLLKAWRFQLLLQPVYSGPWKLPWKVFLASQPAIVLPAGVTAQVGLMKEAGVDVGRASAPVLLSSLEDQVVLILASLFAALWFEPARMPVFVVLGILATLGLLVVWGPSRTWITNFATWGAKRINMLQSLHNFTASVAEIGTVSLLAYTFGITIVDIALKYSILVCAAWGMQLDLQYWGLFLAFVVPSLLGRLVPVPAGIGVVDASMVGFLTATVGINTSTAAALAAMYRVISIFLPVLVGTAIYFLVWRGRHENAALPEEAAASGAAEPDPETAAGYTANQTSKRETATREPAQPLS